MVTKSTHISIRGLYQESLTRLRAWWSLPRIIGIFAAILGLAYYIDGPIPYPPLTGIVEFHGDIAPELIGLGLTLILVDWAVERQQRKQFKGQLIRQMSTNVRDVSVPAAMELGHHGWLRDGSLKGAFLFRANLSGAILWGANLSEAFMTNAILNNAELMGANLSKTDLQNANLRKVDLLGANLSGAILVGANLSEAKLRLADLRGAILIGANLSGAHLEDANLDGADLRHANLSRASMENANLSKVILEGSDLSGVKGLTIEQLEQADRVEAAVMPDRVQLRREEHVWLGIQHPTFEEWKLQYLAKQEAERAEGNPDGAS